MLEKQTFLALIPARGGSKGLPRKNVLEAGGKPLLAWSIDAARQSRYLDRLVLSSDDAEIIETARRWGCEVPFTRPAELAQDATPGMDVVLHAMRNLPRHDYLVLLQPTSPLRTASDIDGCIETCLRQSAPACVSVTLAPKSPYWMFHLDAGQNLQPVLGNWDRLNQPRQSLPPVYVLNGAVYVAQWDWLLENKSFLAPESVAYVMPEERSLDIDTRADFERFRQVVEQRL
jgi:N-acylneuraminate cytidylyltransferase